MARFTHWRSAAAVLLSVSFLAPALARQAGGDEPAGWTPELALKVKRVGSVTPSPDGTLVAFTVSEAVMDEETSEWRTHIHIATADGRRSFQLTRGEKSCSSPQWSPNGAWIAFTSSRGGEKTNLWRIRIDGGEAEPLTDAKSGVGAFRWSPDGAHIAFTMSDPETEEDEAEKKRKDDARVVDTDFDYSHLYLVPVEPDADGEREVERLTEGEFNVGGAFGGNAFDWAPDGSAIAFVHTPTPRVNDWPLADISIVEIDTKEIRPLATTRAAENGPLYSPDGSMIAYTVSDDPPTWGFTARVHVIDADANGADAAEPLADTFDQQPGIIGWAADSERIYFQETRGTYGVIHALPLDGDLPVSISPTGLNVGSVNLNRTNTHFGLTSETPEVPVEAFIAQAAPDFEPVQVSDVQDLPDLPLGRTEVIDWRSDDGTPVEGLLTYPVGYDEGRRVPLLTIVHGGPTGVFTQRFIGNRGAYSIAAFAAEGFAVLRCNPRGSSGYGRDFRYANYDDWGFGDYRDIMTGVDHVIAMGVADTNRLGIMGWSYGGFMTSWTITQTDRFHAASVGAGVTNLMSFTGTADIPGFIPDYFHGEFWEDLEAYLEHSAMFNVAGVTTPTLIQHGEQDARVPVTQGYELYNALKRQNVPVTMVVYPRQPHGIREPRLQLDAMRRNVAWFEQWLKPSAESMETPTP